MAPIALSPHHVETDTKEIFNLSDCQTVSCPVELLIIQSHMWHSVSDFHYYSFSSNLEELPFLALLTMFEFLSLKRNDFRKSQMEIKDIDAVQNNCKA